MHIVDTKHVRVILGDLMKSLNATGNFEITSWVGKALADIMQHEKTIVMGEDKNQQVDRLWRVKNAN